MAHQKRVECVTEGIFLDSVKRTELKTLYKFLCDHLNKLKDGFKSMEEEIIKVVDLKILFDDVEFHSLREQRLPVPAAVQVKGMKFEHISLRHSLFSNWYVEQLIKKQARIMRGATPSAKERDGSKPKH